MKLVFATNNRHKLEEVAAILGAEVGAGGAGGFGTAVRFELLTPRDCGITEDIPETCDTLEGNALQKARYIYERTGLDCFADDTGLEVAVLGGAPGVRSARYAADAGVAAAIAAVAAGGHDFDENNRLLLKNMEGAADRSARFRTVIALILHDGNGVPKEYLFEGTAGGRIIDEYRGSGGFGYDPVFVPEGAGCTGGVEETFAEMSAERKNAISHRARAVEKLKDFLNEK